nr:hypothetical protein [Tanacetum cinerariifolium]
MALIFADTHNIITYLTKSDASEGFYQIIDFLNASTIKYALTVNRNIYVSYIKQFWSFVSVKKVNDVTRLHALIDRKKVITTEATVREALRLDDAESIDSLPNEEIFTDLVRNVDSSTKFYMYPRFLQLMIKAQVGDLSSHIIKYSSPTLTQKVFANMRRVGKGFSRVETPLFEGMIVAQQANDVVDEVAAGVNVNDVFSADVEPSIPALTPTTQPPPPSQDLPSTLQVIPTPPPSPIAQPSSPLQQQPSQPTHNVELSMDLLQTLLETCTALTRRVENLEQDNIAQAIAIIKLKQRVKKLERKEKLKVSGLRRLRKVGTNQEEVEVDKNVEIKKDANVQRRQAESLAQIYKIDLEHADKVLSMQDDELEPSKLKVVVEVVTTTKLMTKVVIVAAATITAATTPIAAATIIVIQVAQKKVKIAFENADSSSRVELIPSKIKYAIKVVLSFYKEFLMFSSLSRKENDGLLQDQCQPKNHGYYHKQNSCYDSNSFSFDHGQPLQYTVNHHIFNAHNAFLDSQNELSITQNKIMEQMTQLTSMCEMACQIIQKKQEEKQIEEEQATKAQNSKIHICYNDDDDYYSAITPNESVDSLSMGDEHLNTILATESDKLIKSCVENLVSNLSESEGENGCDVLACFITFSNVLFDAEYEFDSVDDQSCSDEDVPEKIFSNPLFEKEISSMRIDQHHFNAESDLIQSLLNRDSSIFSSSSKIDSLLDEFAGELTLLKSIPPGIDETDCHPENEIRLTKRLCWAIVTNMSTVPTKLASAIITKEIVQ